MGAKTTVEGTMRHSVVSPEQHARNLALVRQQCPERLEAAQRAGLIDVTPVEVGA